MRKNYRHLRKWAKRTRTDCFRIYDRDSKEYPLAVDYYAGRFCVHHFSYDDDEAPKKEVEDALKSLFGITSDVIYWRTRIKRKKIEQYEKKDEAQEFFPVVEYGIKFYVNLQDYLDTGLFLDHRETRRMVAAMAKGKRLLNLFAYTCSFSLHAAMAGAAYTKSVDLSNTYTSWGKRNFLLNDLSENNNKIIVGDCMRFLESEKELFDLIIIDPPTLSRSKKMSQFFDVQRDYVFLIQKALSLLAKGGHLFFSTNARKFIFDSTLFLPYEVKEISKKTIPMDFHNQKIHRCWVLQ